MKHGFKPENNNVFYRPLKIQAFKYIRLTDDGIENNLIIIE